MAKEAELPFQLYNNNVVIVKASMGPIKDLNVVLDNGTSPTSRTRSHFLELGIPVAGIAGLDVLSRGNFTVDYQKMIFFGRSAATK